MSCLAMLQWQGVGHWAPPHTVRGPEIGDVTDVSVIELMVKVGDTIKTEQSFITLESDKASMEIPASQGGVVES